ncbi:MAG: 4Fe-4S dicluster domain-containing protein [Chloroflexota bacterium]|nr:4Fe-4S dicluster domain-containing protein [Chloroflexota bacterium]
MRFISTQALRDWLDVLAKQVTLIAPVETETGQAPGLADPLAPGMNTLYQPVGGADKIAWDFKRTVMSAREFLFPKTETLFTIEADASGKATAHETKWEGQQVIFGIRPCDARGMRVLDSVMLEQEPADACYAQRRRNTTLVGLSCPEMWENCFCTSVGGAPNSSDDVDILLTQVEDGYVVQIITEKGEGLAQGVPLQEVEGLVLPEPRINETFETPTEQQWLDSFNDVYWDRVGERCLSCRACVYVCPTCRCFDVRDETVTNPVGERITRRVRSWDSCQGVNYRTVAGGANPRANPGQRARNRFYCKFYYVPTDYNVPVGCVGCGRCITACPVNIDISEVLCDLAQRGKHD